MDRTDIDSLLRKAQTLADYAVNTNQLPEDSLIIQEIDSMRQAAKNGEDRSPAPLYAEMQKVSKKSKITVEQLMHRQTPLGRLSHMAALATPYLIGLMTLLLTLYLAFQSSELHKANLALREYQDLASQHLEEMLYRAWKMYRYDHVLNVNAPTLEQLDGYQHLVDDSKHLYEKRAAVQDLLINSSVIRYLPEFFGHPWLMPAVPLSGEAAGQIELKANPLDCSVEPWPPVAGDPALLESGRELDKYKRSIDCFVESLQIAADYDYPMGSMIYSTRNKVNLLVSWMLPGLYGLLGACVFLLRDMLHVNRTIKAHGGDARIIDLLTLLLRVALGGLAGIIVGWFWVPTSPASSSSAIDVSSISFGVAFLAGYSIDSLFAKLDRLIENFVQTDGKKPT